MKCPGCGGSSSVLATLTRDGGRAIRRRRQCLVTACKHRWTTIEFEARKVVAYLPKSGR